MKTLGHLRFTQITLEPGEEWLDQAPVWRFLHLHSGAGYWMGEAPVRALTGGELMVIVPGSKAVIRASQLNEVVLQGFSFAPDLLCGTLTLDESHFFEARAGADLDRNVFLPSTHPATERFAALTTAAETLGALAQRAEALRIVAEVFDPALDGNKTVTGSGTSATERFQQFVAGMPEFELINYAPAELARLCGCSSRHFNRLFWKHFGASVRARQTELRLLRARQLLGSTDGRIVQVAFQSGYRNLSLFNSLFKRRFGMTPSEWRRQIKAESNGAEPIR